MACPDCINHMGRCGSCGADLRKGTESEPIGKPPLPPRRRPPPLYKRHDEDPGHSQR